LAQLTLAIILSRVRERKSGVANWTGLATGFDDQAAEPGHTDAVGRTGGHAAWPASR
jgi:hypothetical protein